MRAEYKRDLQNNYLILEAQTGDVQDGYTLHMVEQNQVRGLLPMHWSRRDGRLYLHYEITGRQSLESLYENKTLKARDILMILTGIRDTLEGMKQYLLQAKQLLFAPEMIYLSADGREVRLCYYVTEDACPISMLAEFVIRKLDHKDEQAVRLGYGFHDRALSENFSLAKTLQELLTETTQISEKEAKEKEAKEEAKVEEKEEKKQEKASMRYYEPDWEEEREEEGEVKTESKKLENGVLNRFFSVLHPMVLLTALMGVIVLEVLVLQNFLNLTQAGGCFFLMLALECCLNRLLHRKQGYMEYDWEEQEEDEDLEDEYEHLYGEIYDRERIRSENQKYVRQREGKIRKVPKREAESFLLQYRRGGKGGYEDISVPNQEIYVGKLRERTQVLLPSETVSRVHAMFHLRNGNCYLRDLNSKNGTFLNGRRLRPQEDAQVRPQDVVAFAQIEFQAIGMRK